MPSHAFQLPKPAPAASYRAHKAEIDEAIAEVFRSGWFILGRQTAAFEAEFAAFLGASHCVGVGNGTDAVEMALRVCGIGPGDAVLTVSHTAVATVAAIECAGAAPVFVDIDPVTFTMDPESLEATISAYRATERNPLRLAGVIVVHLYGHPADMPSILAIAQRHGLLVVEDCAQSHGATWDGRTTGTWGDLGAFSFYPTKNLGAFGDGGAVVTNRPDLAEKLTMLREYGWSTRYVSATPGLNSRLDELQAAILRRLLRHLPAENKERALLAARYGEVLAETGWTLPQKRPSAAHVFHQYVIRSPLRDGQRALLEQCGIATQIHYPVPVHLQPAYQGRFFIAPTGLPQTEKAARQILSLPISPHWQLQDLEAMCRCITNAIATKA